MPPLSAVLTIISFIAAIVAWLEAGRVRRRVDDHLSALTDLDYAFAEAQGGVTRTLQRVADHFRRPTLGSVTPDMLVEDAVVACPSLREIFLARRGGKPRMVWDLSIRDFADHFGQDLDALMQELQAMEQRSA